MIPRIPFHESADNLDDAADKLRITHAVNPRISYSFLCHVPYIEAVLCAMWMILVGITSLPSHHCLSSPPVRAAQRVLMQATVVHSYSTAHIAMDE